MTDSTVDSPWPDGKDVVFLCDTRSGRERSMLKSFVSKAKHPVGAAPPQWVQISLEGGEELDNTELTAVVGQPDSTYLVPMRVARLPDRGVAEWVCMFTM